eukprot:scaffold132468_cov75-Phaeocystis_antarctica.AAC.5
MSPRASSEKLPGGGAGGSGGPARLPALAPACSPHAGTGAAASISDEALGERPLSACLSVACIWATSWAAWPSVEVRGMPISVARSPLSPWLCRSRWYIWQPLRSVCTPVMVSTMAWGRARARVGVTMAAKMTSDGSIWLSNTPSCAPAISHGARKVVTRTSISGRSTCGWRATALTRKPPICAVGGRHAQSERARSEAAVRRRPAVSGADSGPGLSGAGLLPRRRRGHASLGLGSGSGLGERRARVRVESQHQVEHGHEEAAAADAAGSGKRAHHEDQRGCRVLTEDDAWPERLVRAPPAVCAVVAVLRQTLKHAVFSMGVLGAFTEHAAQLDAGLNRAAAALVALALRL